MSRYLRICGAYSYRLIRRHSTILLITALVVTITIVLQLYASRSHGHPHAPMRIGDFDYRPGAFLRGVQPNENTTYCDFNYGLPESLNWNSFLQYPSPEIGNKGPYRVIYNAIKSRAYDNHSKYDAVTYATHATPEFLYHVVEIARYWDGPISLSVFVPDYDLDITMQIMTHLCHCYEHMEKVSLHLIYLNMHPPKLTIKEERAVVTTEISTTTQNITLELQKKMDKYRMMDEKSRAQYIQWVRKRKIERMMMLHQRKRKNMPPNLSFEDCSGLDSFDIHTYRREQNMIYPINVARNVARNASKTNYFIVSDIEMVPSDGLAPKFLTMVRKLMGDKKREKGCVFAKTIFVVPLFEVERGEEIPRDKDTQAYGPPDGKRLPTPMYNCNVGGVTKLLPTSQEFNDAFFKYRSAVGKVQLGADFRSLRLVQLVQANRAMYFHQKVCPHCQRFPGLQSWLLRKSPEGLEPMLIARREYPYHRWEPLYFGTHKEPWYSEMLSWEGRQDKMTQMFKMCIRGYFYTIIDGGFLCHASPRKRRVTRILEEYSLYDRAAIFNMKAHRSIVKYLTRKYANNSNSKEANRMKCCVAMYED